LNSNFQVPTTKFNLDDAENGVIDIIYDT
jgi:hypothetical protein